MKKRWKIEPVKKKSIPIWEIKGNPIGDMLTTWIHGIEPVEKNNSPVRIDYISGSQSELKITRVFK